jgi:predicted CoA-binding protein
VNYRQILDMKTFMENAIIHTLKTYRNIAVVGISTNTLRPSYGVALAMLNNGYNIIPVNPRYDNVFERHCYNNLLEIKEPVEIVNIFRRSDQVMPIVEDAIRINAKVIWMQSGIVNEQAAQKAEQAGLVVIMNRCIKVEHAINYNEIIS